MTPSIALRLARYFGNPPAFWMNLQLHLDLYFARLEEKGILEGIQPYQPPIAGD
jgi:antitoxin HigA-1